MSFDIDSGIFIAFLVVTLVAGLFSSRGTKNIQEYAVGDRRFSTATIVATIIATWIGGEFFYVNLAESYTNGLNHIWVAVLGDFFAILIVGTVLAPRMGEFLGKLSIAEANESISLYSTSAISFNKAVIISPLSATLSSRDAIF